MFDSESRTAGSRWAARLAWAFLLTVYLVVAAAWLWDYSLTRDGAGFAALVLGAFLVRVLGVHAAIPGALILLIAVAMRRWRYALACLPLLAFLLWPVHDGLEGGHRVEPRDGDVTVMTVNLRYDAEGHKQLLRQIDKVDPDFVFFQEYSRSWVDAVRDGLSGEYPHIIEYPRSDPQGIALYSREPFVDSGDGPRVKLGEWDVPNIRAVVEVDGRRLVLYDVHLPMPLSLNAHSEQRLQVHNLLDRVRDEDDAVLIAGDFNLTETTTHHGAFLDAGLRSAWDTLREGRGETWRRPGPLGVLPGLRLDHIMVNDGVDLKRIERGDRNGSDHWPLVVEFSMKESS